MIQNTQSISVFSNNLLYRFMLKKISKINYRIKIVNKISLSFINLYSFIKHSVFVFSTANIKIPKIISDFIIFHEIKVLQSQVTNFGLVKKIMTQNICSQHFYLIKIFLYFGIYKYYIICENKEYTVTMSMT